MKIFKNRSFKERDYETTNIVACVSNEPQDTKHWVEANDFNLAVLTKLHSVNGTTFYGYL